jgi:hypothetical protein
MRGKRPIFINNSLVHGICNYNCRLCGVNKATYQGPKEYQPREVTQKLMERCREAAREGIRIRYLENSGDGESTLHPEFAGRMDDFGEMIRAWGNLRVPPPNVCVVSNGLNIHKPNILEALARNPITLIISFPTPVPEHYGMIMTGKPEMGAKLLEEVTESLQKAMALCAERKLQQLKFHLSPPERDFIRGDFLRTLDFLTSQAKRAGLAKLELMMTSATSNRSGLIQNPVNTIDLYRDLLKKFHHQMYQGVQLDIGLVVRRFFPNYGEISDILFHFKYPCLWNSQLFITAHGSSICANDQAVRNPQGNIMNHSIGELVAMKENFTPGAACKSCDQNPAKMQGSPLTRIYSRIARARMRSTIEA